jgi:chromosome partitioning protein
LTRAANSLTFKKSDFQSFNPSLFHSFNNPSFGEIMKTILVTSQKGGSGKTTLVGLLSVEADRVGDGPVWIIDTDPQATLTHWHERRAGETPHRAEVPFDRLDAGLKNIKGRGGAYCFIDTAPTISSQSAGLIRLADLVLIPVRPSPADLWASAQTVALVKEARKPFLFAITQAKNHATITAQTIAALSKHGPVADAFIADRVLYAGAMTGGKTAPELSPKSAAAEEVALLWQNLKSGFHENSKPMRKAANA